MRRSAAFVCSILCVVFFQPSFGGSAAGHQIRIVVQHQPSQNKTGIGAEDMMRSEPCAEPVRMEKERYTASLGFEGASRHFRWVQNKVDPKRNCVPMNHPNEIEDALPALFRNADRSEIHQVPDSTSNAEKRLLIYCTVTDVM